MKVSLTTDLELLAEAGNPDVLHLFGVQVGSVPVDVDHLTPEQQATLAGNRFVTCDGAPAEQASANTVPHAVSPEVLALRERLDAMDVPYDKRWSAKRLQDAIDKAMAEGGQ